MAQPIDVYLFRNNELVKALWMPVEEFDRRIERYRNRCEAAGKDYTVVHPFPGAVEIHKAA